MIGVSAPHCIFSKCSASALRPNSTSPIPEPKRLVFQSAREWPPPCLLNHRSPLLRRMELQVTDGLQINLHGGKEGTVIHLRGRLNIDSSPDLRKQLLVILRANSRPEKITVDLAAVSYMDTSGLA